MKPIGRAAPRTGAVRFSSRIKVSIEHGHANKRSDDLSSVAYWYQAEPHKSFSILPVEERIPRQG